MEKRIKILLVEDDKVDQLAFQRFVKRENLPYDYVIAGSLSEARDCLTNERFDIALLDYMLGGGTAFDLFAVAGDTPIVVITGSGDQETAVRAMKAGAGDYLIKDPQGNYLTVLPATVERILRQWRVEEELQQYRERLEELVAERTAALSQANAQLVVEIAERERAEEDIYKLSQFRGSVIDNANVWLNVLDVEANIVVWNRAAAEISGYTCAEVLGHNKIWEWLYPDAVYRDKIVTQATTIINRGAVVEDWETTIRRKDGATRTISWNYRNLVDRQGTPTGSIALGRDITERQQLEEQLRRQERLAVVGQLAAGIAHDFRNILAVIILYAQLALRKPTLPPELAKIFEIISSQSKKAANLVQQILDFSSRSMIERQTLDLKPFTGNVLEVLRRTIPEHIRFTLAAEAEEYIVEADANRLEQALMNLVLNSRDAMPQGGELRVTLSKLTLGPAAKPPVAAMSTGEWICLTVADTGIGMPAEVYAHLFEPFFTTKEVGQGTGLGLAQVYGIIKMHKGHIDVETKLGEGTTVYIYLPAGKLEEEWVANPTAGMVAGQGETLLVVEDSQLLRDVIETFLKALNYRVLSAPHGHAALKIYETERDIDLVVTDLVMPEMGGEELLRELQKRDPQLGALGLTGYVDAQLTTELRQSGFRELLQKPFEIEALGQAIHRALDAER
ncbi:MAG TPA: response regulator [Thermoflexia bacterium]|nr:response regulator [Thermoflexia bacterium]